MHDDAGGAPAMIPAQRSPVHDSLPAGPRRGGRGRRFAVPALLAALLAAGVAIVVGTTHPPVGLLAPAAADAAPVIPLTPYEQSTKSLDEQATALMHNDLAGWLAAVDPRQPALRKHYQDLYASLKALHVTQFEYHGSIGDQAYGAVVVNAEMVFCLSEETCPPYESGNNAGPPRINQQLTFRRVGSRYVITKLAKSVASYNLQPMPWEAGDLVFAQGKRVTVGAPPSLAKSLPKVLAVADKAALVDDRYAKYMENPRQRYRIFLASDKTWKTWYGGDNASYSVAYTIPLYDSGSDVVLHMSQLDGDTQELKVVIQHELAHVATLSNLTTADQHDQWLMEGVADYIGWLPQHTRSDWNFLAVRAAFRGSHPPKSIVQAPLADNASGRAVDTFYGLGHFAVECLVATYGEPKAMTFVRLKLRLGDTLDVAAKGAFGTSFATVNRTCITWMRKNAR